MLQPLRRYCFVLRILAGLSPEVSAELLDISVTELEDAVYAALTELTPLRSPKTQPIRYWPQWTSIGGRDGRGEMRGQGLRGGWPPGGVSRAPARKICCGNSWRSPIRGNVIRPSFDFGRFEKDPCAICAKRGRTRLSAKQS